MGIYYACFRQEGSSNPCDKVYPVAASFRFQRRVAPQYIRVPGLDAGERIGLNYQGADETYTLEIIGRGAGNLQQYYNDLRALSPPDVLAKWYFTLKYSTAGSITSIDPASDTDVIGPMKVFVETVSLDLSAGADYFRITITVSPVR